MLLEKDRIKQEQDFKDTKIKSLEEQVESGKSAERLLSNLDWKRIYLKIEQEVLIRKKELQEHWTDIIMNSDMGLEGDTVACNKVRKAAQEVSDFEYLLNLPQEEMRIGESASQELAKLRGEESK